MSSDHLLLSCLMELEYTKAVTLHCDRSGRWYGLMSFNLGDPSWVKSTCKQTMGGMDEVVTACSANDVIMLP